MISEIINLKKRVSLLEDDATNLNQFEWYSYIIKNNLIEVEFDGDELIGFIEWVRLDKVPTTLEDIYENRDYTKGEVVFVVNSVSTNGALLKMRERATRRVSDATHICFHRKKDGKIKCFQNIRRGYALPV